MKASYYERYGTPEVLRFGERPRPDVKPGEVRVRVHAAALNPKDVLVRKGKFRRMHRDGFPRIPGYDFAGVVETSRSELFSVGQEVFGMVQSWDAGACAEYVVVSDDELTQMPVFPSEQPFEDAAAVPLVALTALQALRDLAKVQAGESVVINGASGGLGTAAIQVACALGAEVTAVCSARNAELVRSLGANAVLPYDERAFVERSERFDVVCDFFGTAPYSAVRSRLKPGGRYVTAIPSLKSALDELISRVTPRSARLVVVKSRRADLEVVARWMRDGLFRPVVDSRFGLEDAAEAHRRLESRRARGKIVLRVQPG